MNMMNRALLSHDHSSSNESAITDVVVPLKPVLFVVDSYFPAMAGAERQALVLARALRERGLKVEFVVPFLERWLPLEDEVEGFKIHRIDYPRIKFLGATLLMFNFSRYMMQHRHEYSYVHVHITKLLAACLGLLKPWLGLKVITKVSGHAEFTGGVLDKSKKYNPVYRLLGHYIHKLDYIHAISDYTREVLIDSGFDEQQILQIPNAVEIARFQNIVHPEKDDKQTIRIGFCGRVEKVKGLDVLMAACHKLDPAIRERITIVIAGNGRYLQQLKELVEQLGLNDNTEFLGVIDNVPEFLGGLDIYVQPSWAEGLSNSLLEAMSASLPVVASRISGNTDLVEDGKTGYLFDKGDSLQLAEKLDLLISDPAKRASMGSQAKDKIVGGYSTESVSQRLFELYCRV
ncbi:MAG: glycosyltransferase family 4 protein [Gammaproteobacteria bacterium]|nr:glycosyltransferase family 4 protein [Gammaproteobacteria bacterium]